MTERDQFAIECFPDGGILLDLAAGTFFELNAVASLIWQKYLAGVSKDEIVAEISTAFDVGPNILRGDIDVALSLPSAAQLRPPDTGCWYELVDDRYRYSFKGRPVLEITKQGDAIRRVRNASPELLVPCLAALSPKLLALRGCWVLHASAVLRPDGAVLIFAGESGAGKTTTAKAFQRQGWDLVSEDKVVLKSQDQLILAARYAEPNLSVWVKETSERLRATVGETWFQVGGLMTALEGEGRPIREVFFLNRLRREGTQIQIDRLSTSAAASELFKNAFFGSSDAAQWRRYLAAIGRLARDSDSSKATVPNGLKALGDAIRAYTENVAS